MQKKWNSTDVCDYLSKAGYKFISGKFFLNEIEIRDFHKKLYSDPNVRQLLSSSNDTDMITNTFIDMYGEVGTWPALPIIEEARKQAELKPLCFPLNDKQLIIINRLLMGADEKFFILTGVGGSGKSTFANIIVQIFGGDVASLTLGDLSNDFKLATGVNKRLVYADELNSDDLNNGIIKTIVSKQQITINPKYGHSYNTIWQGGLLFSCNKPPRLDLSDTGILRRIIYYSMNEKIKNPDPNLQKKVYTHEDLVNIVAHALAIDTSDWEYLFEKETRALLRSNNSVYICCGKSLNFYSYEKYKEEAQKCGLRAFSEPRFDEVKNLLLKWEDEEKGMIDDDDLPF